MPTIPIEPSSSQKHGSDHQSSSSAQQYAPAWMLKPSSYNSCIIACAFSRHMHLTTASASAAMRLKFWTSNVASHHRKKCRGFVRQRHLLQRALISQMSSALLVCLRRSRLSSLTTATSWPFGRKLKGGRATRNLCCTGIHLIHVHVAVDQRRATPGLPKRNYFTGAMSL